MRLFPGFGANELEKVNIRKKNTSNGAETKMKKVSVSFRGGLVSYLGVLVM